MTKLYKNTGVEYEITYPPPPEPPPPAPDPQIPKPPKTNVETQTETPDPKDYVQRYSYVELVSCTTSWGFKGVRMFVDGNPAGPCQMVRNQGIGG